MGIETKIQAALRGNPAGNAIAFGDDWVSWSEVSSIAGAIDQALDPLHLEPGARIGLVARNRPPHVAAFAGVLARARNAVMIYSAQSPEAIAADILRLRLPAIIADAQDWTPATRTAAKAAGSLGIALTGHKDRPVEAVQDPGDDGRSSGQPGDPDIAMELLSSGTTGAPKRVKLLRRTFELAVEDAAMVYAAAGGSKAAPGIVFQPLGNIAGVTFLIPFLTDAQPIVLLEQFSVPAWLEAVSRHRPARTSLPPAALRMILDQGIPKADLASLTAIGVGAVPLDPRLQEQFEAAYDIPLLPAYGATEFCGVVANWTLPMHQAFGAAKRGSAGRARPGVLFRITGEDGNVLPAGEHGILEALVPRVGPEWITTTDIASLDADGFLFLHGRADGAINRGGFKILPETIARRLRAHPAVADAAVIGIPDLRLAAVPVAVVESRPGCTPSEAELLIFCRQELLSYQIPTQIRIVPVLPRNASMKINLPAIREMLEAK
jgi:acyl-CoA synthetase (AMP-forming)/AMP-acid ligase II